MKTFLTQDLRKNINVLSINTLVSFTFCMKTYKRVRMFNQTSKLPTNPKRIQTRKSCRSIVGD